TAAASITRAIIGMTASAWPRAITSVSLATIPPRSVSSRAAAQASSAVSMARTRMVAGRRSQLPDEGGEVRRPLSRRPDLDHVGQIMAQQVLDAVPQRRGRRRAARAGALHVEIDDAVLEPPEGDVAAVVRHRRPHPRLDELLDGGDGFRI